MYKLLIYILVNLLIIFSRSQYRVTLKLKCLLLYDAENPTLTKNGCDSLDGQYKGCYIVSWKEQKTNTKDERINKEQKKVCWRYIDDGRGVVIKEFL